MLFLLMIDEKTITSISVLSFKMSRFFFLAQKSQMLQNPSNVSHFLSKQNSENIS